MPPSPKMSEGCNYLVTIERTGFVVVNIRDVDPKYIPKDAMMLMPVSDAMQNWIEWGCVG